MLICFLGLSYQLSRYTISYLSYTTATETRINAPIRVYVPQLSICFRYIDIVNGEMIKKYKNITIKRPYDTTKDEYMRIRRELTFKEIFDWTPSARKIFGSIHEGDDEGANFAYEKFAFKNSAPKISCRYRPIDRFISVALNKSECHEVFEVSKYHHREFMCYKFRIRNNMTRISQNYVKTFLDANADSSPHYNMIKVALSKSIPGQFYQLILNEKYLKNIEYFTLYVHHDSSSKLFDSTMTTIMIRGRSLERGGTILNRYTNIHRDANSKDADSHTEADTYTDATGIEVSSTYYATRIKRLPFPYDTDCQKLISFQTSDGKEFNCSNRKLIERYNLISPLLQTPLEVLNYTQTLSANSLKFFSPEKRKHLEKEIRIASGKRHENASVVNFAEDDQVAKLEQTLQECHLASRLTCDFNYVATRSVIKEVSSAQVSNKRASTVPRPFSVSLDWPQDSNVVIEHAPKVPLTDFIFQVTSCFSVWFNFDFFSFLLIGSTLMNKLSEANIVRRRRYERELNNLKVRELERRDHFERQLVARIEHAIKSADQVMDSKLRKFFRTRGFIID